MRAVLAVALLSACGAAAQPPQSPASQPVVKGPLTPAQIAEIAMPSVVLIKTPTALGTGFIVWKDGRIATNLHVIAGAREATVTLNDGREFKQIEVLGADDRHDLVVLRIAAHDLTPLKLGDSHAVKPGERVVAIGHPLGLGNTVSDGLVSGVRELDPQITLLQISAPIAAGSSGGPLFNDRAEVIGVATLFSSEGQNLNFGVPVAYLKPLLLTEKAVSLADFAQQADLGLLDGCSIDEVRLAVTTIADAIQKGAPLYNQKDHQGCFDLYQKASLDIVGKLKGCQGVRETLLAALTAATHAPTPGEKAWALRHAFDRVLGAFDAAVDRQQQRKP